MLLHALMATNSNNTYFFCRKLVRIENILMWQKIEDNYKNFPMLTKPALDWNHKDFDIIYKYGLKIIFFKERTKYLIYNDKILATMTNLEEYVFKGQAVALEYLKGDLC